MQGPAFSGWLLAHDMRATRFSGFRRSGFLRSGALIAAGLLLSVSAPGFAAGQTAHAPTQHPSAPHSSTPHAAARKEHPRHAPAPASPAAAPARARTAPGTPAKSPARTTAQPPVQTPPAQTAPVPPPPQPGTTPRKKLTRPERIAALADQLVQAKTPEDAQRLEARLEELRAHGLSPTTQLLLRRAEKDSQADKPDDAVEDLGDALALQPDKAILWRSRAQMRLAAGDYAGAITDLGESLQRDSRDARSWGLLSTVEEQRKDAPAALKAWQKVLELNPMADKNHKRLDALHIKAFGQPT